MILEQKIAEAKEKRRKRLIYLIAGFFIITLLCGVVVYFTSYYQMNEKEANAVSPDLVTETEKNVVADSLVQTQTVPDEQLRQSYINALTDYENNIKPELNKIDLTKWDKSRSDRLVLLQEEALSNFSIADYAGALSHIEKSMQLAQVMIADSQLQFATAFSNAQNEYNVDNYNDAKFHIANALMLNKQSVEAVSLSDKINSLSEILPLLEKINIARIENNYEKELSLIKEIIELVPERESAVERKKILVDTIDRKNFKSNIAQSYHAIELGNVGTAKQKLIAAKNISPDRQEILDVTIALQELEKNQRLDKYQQAAQTAIAADDWVTARQQLELALQERVDDKMIKKSLVNATTIISLKSEFDQNIDNPYRLSNKQVASNVYDKLAKANALVNISPSLNEKVKTLASLVASMNKKVSVEVISDNQTNILVRGVGVVGITQSKMIQLTPGHYKFEGKRKGFKSKLLDVLIPYDTTVYRIDVICDEPI